MPETVSMQDVTPDRYDDTTRWIGRHGVTDVVWPCPRCGCTLTAPAGHSMTIHDCSDGGGKWTPARQRASDARVAAWWAGYDAAQATAEPCTERHAPADAYIAEPTYSGLLALNVGDTGGHVLRLPDNDDHGARNVVLPPVYRAVLIARLRAWADLLATPTETGADQ